MPDSPESRAAYERGKKAAKIEDRLNGHDKHFDLLNGQMDKVGSELEHLNEQVSAMMVTQEKRDAVAKALKESVDSAARAATSAATKQVSTRSFYIGLAMMFCALGGLFVSVAKF